MCTRKQRREIEAELTKLELCERTARTRIQRVVTEILKDGQINKGRLYILFYIIYYTKRKTGVDVFDVVLQCILNKI